MYCPNCGKQIPIDSEFCPNCGKQMKNNNQPINNKTISNNKQNTKQFITGLLVGLIIVGILFITISETSNSTIFLDDIYNEKNNEKTTTTNYTGKTIIERDNTYAGVTISSVQDAVDLIVEDSVNQKNTCPEEIIEVENKIIDEFNITAVNLCELDLNVANDTYDAIKYVYDMFPDSKDHLTNLTLMNLDGIIQALANFQPLYAFATSDAEDGFPVVTKIIIGLNSKYYLDIPRFENAINASIESGHFPENTTVSSVLVHEMGHYLSYVARLKNYNKDSSLLIGNDDMKFYNQIINDSINNIYTKEMLKEAYNNYQKDYDDDIRFDDWRGTISDYAVAKDSTTGEYIYDETIAEAFSDIYGNGDDAAIASKYVIDVLLEKLEE